MKDKVKASKPLVVAQFSDCHLFTDKLGCHLGANVWQNLTQVLADIAQQPDIDLVIFTGDLTQDNTPNSYQLFAQAVAQAKLSSKVFYLAGNHDEPNLLSQYLTGRCFSANKTLNETHWQIQLIDSKSATPSGLVSSTSLEKLKNSIDKSKHQLMMMHHHPVDIGYYIDKYGLTEQTNFWRAINDLNAENACIKAIACGHVHRASVITKGSIREDQSLDVYTCGATSVQFGDAKVGDTKASVKSTKPNYRLFSLYRNGDIESTVKQVKV